MVRELFLLVLGLFLLIISSQWLIRSSVKLATLLRITPLFIGMVIVAFGTSTPEAGVGIVAAFKGEKAIALGNIVGSNIANIGLILGLTSLLRPLGVKKSIFKRELPIMLICTFLLYIMSLDLLISRLDGLIFLGLFLVFFLISYKGGKKDYDFKELQDFSFQGFLKNTTSLLVVGSVCMMSLVGVAVGANLMVKGGVGLAKIFGVSPWIIAITVFAVGTSLPELAASLVASFKKMPSISVGNIIGSNIFNILFILGTVALIRPIKIEQSYLRFEYLFLIFITILLIVFMKTKYRISRWEGFLLFLLYIFFVLLITGR
ncbi:MAG: sodium:calcium antiporter [Candidatus Omnitrophota bacterium]|nr:MAG: sodium:calcium antiporter [Candidatus Omnitrophota bacterium]